MNAPATLHAVQSLQSRASNKKFAELDADTMPTLAALKLDMTRTTYCGAKGDLIAYITDVQLGQRKTEPALLLCNRANPTQRNVYIRLGELWQLIDPKTLDDAARQQAAVHSLAERLYCFVTKPDLFRVLDAVYDFASDLVHAKPPTWITHGQWLHALAEDDMTVTHAGVVLNG